MDRPEIAFQLMANSKTNCAQAVLSTHCGLFGLDRKTALEIAQGFGGGMARTGQTCGAVTCAYMVIGLSRKIKAENARENVDDSYKLVQEFTRRFKEMHRSTMCTELVGYNLAVPEELAAARREGAFTGVCANLVRDAANIMDALLDLQPTG